MLETSYWFSTCIVEKNIPTRLQNVKYCEIVAFDTGSCLTLNSKTLGIERDERHVSRTKVKFDSGLDSEQENVVGDSDRVSLSELSAYAIKQSKNQFKLFVF